MFCLITLQRLLKLNSVSFPVARPAFFALKQIRGKQAVWWINSKLLLVLYIPNSVMFKHEIQVIERKLSEALCCTRKYLQVFSNTFYPLWCQEQNVRDV